MKRGGPSHPKLLQLCDILGCRRPPAIGYLELLWHFTANYAPRGDIGRYSDRWIENSCDWKGGTGKLVSALIQAGYLDDVSWRSGEVTNHPLKGGVRVAGQEQGRHKGVAPEDLARYRLLVHDWPDHADESVRKRLLRQNQWFIGKVSGHVSGQTAAENLPRVSTLSSTPMPEPMPTPTPTPPPQVAADTVPANGHAKAAGRRRQFAPILPKTGAYIRGLFADVDDRFLGRLQRDSKEAASMTGNDPGMITDDVILQTVKQCTKKNQQSAGLYLKTVPACIKSWGQQQT